MAPPTAEDVLTALHSLDASHEMTILQLSEPISATVAQQRPQDQQKQQRRTSDISSSSLQQEDATTPASLEADLTHYRELFAKLRFSYVEQVTKEKFIRAIVGDPPLIVTPQENLDLERRNLAAKAALKALKTEVADLATELERRARELSRRYEGARLETARLGELPAEIAGLEDAVARLREEAQQGPGRGHLDRPENPELSLPLAKTLELVETRKRQRAELDRQLEQLQSQVPRKKKELERLQAELQPLEAKRQNSTAAAKEARRRKEQALGGVEDDLEERGRWYRAADATLRQMLEIES
ncbi:hypothetical protein DL766_008247 [Monosporascus sp. MC13-8B]|uniref:Kinetochore protein Sos7 coiled-coil domain-containing protein n=1 Tax=Monosporascus cannonballus TaxID=155416 RepID=A0ABY0H300_9PEZI|nr:hypothetical protein DL762_006471 [Monosporascus cannonballus]RYO99628.1 hypothetical protein DL763_001342 [Monosporascus cannonballus]RYP20211.1 hypothetical protein DL766_008247 [Monosporascus sp. MC13-8B]